MKNLFNLLFCLFLTAIISCNSGTKVFPEIDEPLLFETYQIQIEDNKTVISASIFFSENLDFRNCRKFLPNTVSVNEQPMQKGKLESFTFGSSFKVSENAELIPANFDINSKTEGYFISIPNFQNTFEFKISDNKGSYRNFQLFFEPFEFEQLDEIQLSRSKDNILKIKGNNTENKKCSIWGFGVLSDEDEKSIKIDTDKKIVAIPSKVVKKVKGNELKLSIFTIEHNFIDQIVSRNQVPFPVHYNSSYIISNLSNTKVKIIE